MELQKNKDTFREPAAHESEESGVQPRIWSLLRDQLLRKEWRPILPSLSPTVQRSFPSSDRVGARLQLRKLLHVPLRHLFGCLWRVRQAAGLRSSTVRLAAATGCLRPKAVESYHELAHIAHPCATSNTRPMWPLPRVCARGARCHGGTLTRSRRAS